MKIVFFSILLVLTMAGCASSKDDGWAGKVNDVEKFIAHDFEFQHGTPVKAFSPQVDVNDIHIRNQQRDMESVRGFQSGSNVVRHNFQEQHQLNNTLQGIER